MVFVNHGWHLSGMQSTDTVMFVCSGNFYRSRFAEALFNFHAIHRGLAWRAESRGFHPHLATEDLSNEARAALELRNIPLALTRRKPTRLELPDLFDAALVICLKEAEHRPLMAERFSNWAERVRYWHINDIDVEPSGTALIALEQNVLGLIEKLERRQTHRHPSPEAAIAHEF